MPEDTCAPRIASLSEQAKALERRASELAAQQDDDEKPERVSAADLDALRGDLHAMLNDSDPKRVKGVLQAMIDGIRVDARDQIEPTFRVPAVRIESGYMEPAGIEPATSCLQIRAGLLLLAVNEAHWRSRAESSGRWCWLVAIGFAECFVLASSPAGGYRCRTSRK